MDDMVLKAMDKWPHVPDCYGWLGLDARGNWYLRDDRAQACGAFASGLLGAKGSLLTHAKLIGFIARNYSADPQGCWFFQNGPQRVYVELEITPHVWRIDTRGAISSNAECSAVYLSCYMDEQGRAYLQTSAGFGLVHTQDVGELALAIEQNHWQVQEVLCADLPRQFAYRTSPQSEHAKSNPLRKKADANVGFL